MFPGQFPDSATSGPPLPGRGVNLLACQGSVQLVAAIAAAEACRGRSPDAPSQDYLVIHDLCAPAGQDEEFAGGLQRLAKSLRPGLEVTYLRPDEVRRLEHTAKGRGWQAAVEHLRQRLELARPGLAGVDSLFLGQNRLLVNDLLSSLCGDARKHCYGDAIGINFSAGYFATPPRKSIFRSMRAWRAFWKRRFAAFGVAEKSGPAKRNPVCQFDEYCLLLANRFDQHIPEFRKLSRGQFRRLFERGGQWLAAQSSAKANDLPGIIQRSAHLTFLLTSNFSEGLRLSEADELAAYQELLSDDVPASSKTLIVKPHPRDSASKIARLRELLAGNFNQIVVLDDPSSFYVPFESILSNLLAAHPDRVRSARYFCVSSACLSLELLYGLRCTVGFGADVVRRRFRPEWVSPRLRHEQDLRRVVQEIRESTYSAAA